MVFGRKTKRFIESRNTGVIKRAPLTSFECYIEAWNKMSISKKKSILNKLFPDFRLSPNQRLEQYNTPDQDLIIDEMVKRGAKCF